MLYFHTVILYLINIDADSSPFGENFFEIKIGHLRDLCQSNEKMFLVVVVGGGGGGGGGLLQFH